MKEFIKNNFIEIAILIIIILTIIFGYKAIDREYEFYEKTLEYGVENNKTIEIK